MSFEIEFNATTLLTFLGICTILISVIFWVILMKMREIFVNKKECSGIRENYLKTLGIYNDFICKEDFNVFAKDIKGRLITIEKEILYVVKNSRIKNNEGF